MKKIDIIIPSYNGAVLLHKNLPILIKEIKKYNIGQIIIVNDGSKDDDSRSLIELVEKMREKTDISIILLHNKKNVGFSSTVNNGVAASTADLVVFLNTDVVAESNFLDAAISDMEKDEKLFGVGFMDKSVEKDEVVLRGRGLAYWSRGLVIHARGEVDKSDTFWISGGSSIVRRNLFNEIGGFDEIYNPFYWEDIDLSYRARKAGYSLIFEKGSIVEHRHDEGAIKKHFKPKKVRITAYRNQFTFIWKNITDKKLIASHLIWLPYYFARALITRDTAYVLGFLKAILRLPQILKKRKEQMKHYRKSDLELFN